MQQTGLMERPGPPQRGLVMGSVIGTIIGIIVGIITGLIVGIIIGIIIGMTIAMTIGIIIGIILAILTVTPITRIRQETTTGEGIYDPQIRDPPRTRSQQQQQQ